MLTIIQVGHDAASDRYIRNKVKAIEQAGMAAEVVNLPESCTTLDVLDAIFRSDLKVDCKAIMVQLPLPFHIDKEAVLRNIPTNKDIDGLNSRSYFKPLTPCAIMRWLNEKGVNLEGKMVTVLGRSDLVGKPLANMMIEAGATVCVCNSKTPPFYKHYLCRESDIIISAVGKPDTVCFNDVRLYPDDPQIIIDVGINRDDNGKLCGDVSNEAKKRAEYYEAIVTPVPGGVGKWTVRELILRLKDMEEKQNPSCDKKEWTVTPHETPRPDLPLRPPSFG